MEKIIAELTLDQIHRLKNQKFNDIEPGTLLKDFSTLFDFIGPTGIPVSGKNHLVAIKLLPQLNQLMSSPLDVKLKRPQQKSFPHINGLYLLLRAAGLSEIILDKKGVKLMLDNKVLASWKTMNPTERYFALFYAWWHRGSPEIIGEISRGWYSEHYFYDSLDFFLNALGKGLDDKAKHFDPTFFRYRPGLHNLALMELFGFIKIEQSAASNGENWPIAKVEPTAWGRTLINYFAKYLISFNEIDDEPSDDHRTERWGSELKAHIPAWKKGFTQPEAEERQNGVYVFKVILGPAYRKIAVPSSTSLDELAVSILSAFNFSNDHLYEFIFKNRYGITERVVHPYIESDYKLRNTDCVIGELPLHQGMELTFHFDFGDDWQFQLLVESIVAEDINGTEPTVIEQHGIPPEQYPDDE